MSKKRKQYSSNFKVKAALAAIRGDETVSRNKKLSGLTTGQAEGVKDSL